MKLYGRMFIQGAIEVKTGLHIGGSGGAFAIGTVDNPVLVDQVTGQPYIPGSSLRGKMRSLTEKYLGKVTGQNIDRIQIHSCHQRDRSQQDNEAEYRECPICNIYGITAEGYNLPTRLVIRDVPLTEAAVRKLRDARMALPYTEVKTEVSIDRVTSQAVPRDVERVPAGAIFGPMELVYSIYQPQDVTWLSHLIDGMELLEDDYLGGMGSRGSGKIVFRDLELSLKTANNYRQPVVLGKFDTLQAVSAQWIEIMKQVDQTVMNGG